METIPLVPLNSLEKPMNSKPGITRHSQDSSQRDDSSVVYDADGEELDGEDMKSITARQFALNYP